VSDIKSTLRDTEADAKEQWRKVDGESMGDKVANAKDRAGNAVKDAGDKIDEAGDDASRKASYEHGRLDESADRVDDTGV